MDALLVEAADDMIRVFIWTGSVAHLIDSRIILPDEQPGNRTAICGQKPFWPSRWFGNNDEYVGKANSLPLCGRCASVEASREVDGESA
jgi:hypothetical protein